MTRSTVRVAAALLVLALVLPILALVAARADAAVPTTRVVAGEQVVIAGATPQRVRRPVVLQRLVRGHWRAADRSSTSGAGRYRFTLRARAVTYRVLAP